MSQLQLSTLKLRTNQRLIYKYIKENPGKGQNDLSTFFQIRRSTVQVELFPLISMGYIREKVINKKGKKGYWIDKRKRI